MKCEDVYRLFFDEDSREVVEIRAYGCKGKNRAWKGWAGGPGIVFGYFDNADAFGKAAEGLDKAEAPGIYFTLNPVIPDLLARSPNRLMAADNKTPATSDKEILCIRWLPIDLDPNRPTGISSKDEELKEAIKLRNRIWKWLEKEFGASPGIPAMSGNGAHLAYRLPDLPIENRDDLDQDPTVHLVKSCLLAIKSKFENKKVTVDNMVFNPSRIWKLYHTTVRKGGSTKDRPHRRSYVEPKFIKKEG